MLKPLASLLMLASATVYAAQPPLTAAHYAQQLGVGMDVDWARTERGIREFDPLVVRDFRAKGSPMCVFAWPENPLRPGLFICESWWKPANTMA